MRTLISCACALLVAACLAACNSDGTLTVKSQNILNSTVHVTCALDPTVNALAQGGMTIAAVAAPEAAPALLIAKPADALAHQAVMDACAGVAPNSVPVGVSVAVPVATPADVSAKP
jgi:predicted RNase H-like nuclease